MVICMSPIDGHQDNGHRPVIIMANDDPLQYKVFELTLMELYPSTEIVGVDNIADVYGAIQRLSEQGKQVAAIVSDNKFDTKGAHVISASHEIPHIRKKLEDVFGSAGSVTPIILHSGGEFFTSPPAYAFFLDVYVWFDAENNEQNPLHRLLNIALGVSSEPLDKTAIRQSTEQRFWGERNPGWDKAR
jgi:hypothetical protein